MKMETKLKLYMQHVCKLVMRKTTLRCEVIQGHITGFNLRMWKLRLYSPQGKSSNTVLEVHLYTLYQGQSEAQDSLENCQHAKTQGEALVSCKPCHYLIETHQL